MNFHGNSSRIFNLVLGNIFGFYQILDIDTVTFLGRHNVHYRVFVFLIVYECFISVMMGLNGLYYCINNMTETILHFGFMVNSLYAIYKIYIILKHSKAIWACLSITQFDFTSCGLHSRQILDEWRNRSIKFTRIYVIFTLSLFIFYVACPLVFSNTFTTMKNHDGSSSIYRLNILNLYLFVTEEAYNTYFYVFYTIEIIGIAISVLFIIIFDTVMNALGFALSGQLQMISTAFESVGHKSLYFSNGKYLQY